MGGQGDPWGTVREIEIWPYEQVVYAQHRIHLFWDFMIQTDHLISARWPDQVKVKKKKKKKKKKRTWQIVDSTIPVDHRIKLKESGKR